MSFVLLSFSMHAKILFNVNDDDQSPLLLLWRGPMMMTTTMTMLMMIKMIKVPYCSAVERDWEPICKSLLFRLEDLQRNRLGKLKSFLSSFETTQRMMSISFSNLHKIISFNLDCVGLQILLPKLDVNNFVGLIKRLWTNSLSWGI